MIFQSGHSFEGQVTEGASFERAHFPRIGQSTRRIAGVRMTRYHVLIHVQQIIGAVTASQALETRGVVVDHASPDVHGLGLFFFRFVIQGRR